MTVQVDLFCEDAAHEAIARAIAERLAKEEAIEISIRVGSARAGVGRLMQELRAFAEATRRQSGAPDVLVVLIDSNSDGPTVRRNQIATANLDRVFPLHVVGTPDPCVEAWLLADGGTLARLYSPAPSSAPTADCDELKRRLKASLVGAGEIVVQGGAEFAGEIIEAIDLYTAGQAEPTLKRFLEDLRVAFRRAADARR